MGMGHQARERLVICPWMDPGPEGVPHGQEGSQTIQVDAHLDGRFLESADRLMGLPVQPGFEVVSLRSSPGIVR